MPTTQDFQKRLDLSGLTDVTGTSMNQLIDTAYPASDKGLRIVTTDTALDTPDVPDPNTELEGITPTYWANYKWVRIPFEGSETRVKEYNWNPNITEDDILLKWELSVDVELINANLADFETVANEAFDDAQAAQTTATNAQTTANNAQTTANNAQTTANNALTTAQQAVEDIADIQEAIDALENSTVPTVLPISRGGTGAMTIDRARENLGLTRVPLARFYLYETKGLNVDNHNSVINTWTKRQINLLVSDNASLAGYAVLDSNTYLLTLLAGRWQIDFDAPANLGQIHKARLATSAGVVLAYGSGEHCDTTYGSTKSRIVAKFDLAETTVVKIEHITNLSMTAGFGKATNFGESEIYAQGVLTFLGEV